MFIFYSDGDFLHALLCNENKNSVRVPPLSLRGYEGWATCGQSTLTGSPLAPLTLVSPLSLNTEKLGSPNLEVWTIPSTTSSTFIVPVEQRCSFQSTQSQSCQSHHPNQVEYNRPPTNPMNIGRDCRSRNAPLTFLSSMCQNKNGPF